MAGAEDSERRQAGGGGIRSGPHSTASEDSQARRFKGEREPSLPQFIPQLTAPSVRARPSFEAG